ncbi:MAG: ATP synthase F1 subunit epsilon [Bdellovibrionales bacterium]|nr:ATP synthase F1 subunit epsilon [Bdellovibrionales bacterium]
MLNLTLVTPTKKILNEVEVEEVTIPAFKGQLEILPGHSPLMTTLTTGIVTYKLDGEVKKASVSWGYLEVINDKVIVLAETAETAEELDAERIQIAYDKALSMLDQEALTVGEIEKLQRKLQRAENRKDLIN